MKHPNKCKEISENTNIPEDTDMIYVKSCALAFYLKCEILLKNCVNRDILDTKTELEYNPKFHLCIFSTASDACYKYGIRNMCLIKIYVARKGFCNSLYFPKIKSKTDFKMMFK